MIREGQLCPSQRARHTAKAHAGTRARTYTHTHTSACIRWRWAVWVDLMYLIKWHLLMLRFGRIRVSLFLFGLQFFRVISENSGHPSLPLSLSELTLYPTHPETGLNKETRQKKSMALLMPCYHVLSNHFHCPYPPTLLLHHFSNIGLRLPHHRPPLA
jgi:hypothetical protein